MSGFDVGNFVKEDEDGATLTLLDKRGEPVKFTDAEGNEQTVTIKVLGMESNEWRKAEDAVNNRRLKRARNSGRGSQPMQADDFRDDRAFQLASVTVAWSGIALDGRDLECNQANAKLLYLRVPFIATQVDEFIGDRKNFSKASSPT